MAALKEKRVSKRKQLAWLATLSEASAGALGQLFSTLLLYPLDTSKTRIQACLEENASKQNEEEEEEEEAQEITEIEEKQKQKKQKENWKEWALSLYTGIEAKVNRETESLANSHKTPKPSGRLILLTATVFFSPSFLLLLSPKKYRLSRRSRLNSCSSTPTSTSRGNSSRLEDKSKLSTTSSLECWQVSVITALAFFFGGGNQKFTSWHCSLPFPPFPLLTDCFPFLSGSVNVLITQPLDTYVTMKQSNVLQVKAPAEKSKPRLYAGELLSFTQNSSFSVF